MISTHILDTSKGTPVEHVTVKLQQKEGAVWRDLAQGRTNADGRVVFDGQNTSGIYQMIFQVEEYFKIEKRESFYSEIPVIFKFESTKRKYHIPLLLSPFGYSTYRGS